MAPHGTRWLGVLALLAVMANCQAQESRSFELRPGVIVEPAAGRLYLMTRDRKVEAVEIGAGRTAWTSERAAKPLTVSNGTLVAQAEPDPDANALALVVLDARTGERQSAASAALPEGVEPHVVHDLSKRFNARAVMADAHAYIFWEQQVIPARGMPTERGVPGQPPTQPEDKPQQTRGVIKLDLPAGTAAPVRPQDVPRAVEAALPKALSGPEDARPDPTRRLSVDGRHTLTSKRMADAGEWVKYEWTIIEADSGKQVGRMRSHISQTAFVVVGDQLVYSTNPLARSIDKGIVEEPAMLRAVDLSSGKEAWTRPIREVEYRGPYPP